MENPATNVGMLVFGIFSFIASFVGVWLVKKYLSRRFKMP